MIDLFPARMRHETAAQLDGIAKKLGARLVIPLRDESPEEERKNRLADLAADAKYQRERYQISRRGEEKKRERGKAHRQQQILESMRMLQLNKDRKVGPLTVGQIVYRCAISNMALCDADMRDLHTQGKVTRCEVRNHNRKLVWAYTVVD